MNQSVDNLDFSYRTWRAGFLRTTLVASSILGLIVLLPAVIGAANPIYRALYIALYIVLLSITILPIQDSIKAGTLITLIFSLGISGIVETGIRGDARVFMLGAIALGSLLFSWRTGWWLTALTVLIYAISGWLILNGYISITSTGVTAGDLGTWFTGSISVFLIATLIVNGIRLTQTEFRFAQYRAEASLKDLREERSTLEQRVSDRTQALDKRSGLLKAVADVGRSITSFRNLSELLQQTTYLIRENFGHYHVGIFLLDERKEYAVLTATNSEGGRRMLEKGHQLKVGETGIVGYVTEYAKARIALDVGKDAVYFDNPDLPETRSEMALPLVVGGQILGALDVQSTESQAFSDEDSATLQILAEQLAIAIQNANLFNEIERALEASRIGYGEVSREAWSKILRNQPRVGFIATPPATAQTYSQTLDVNLSKAFETGDLILGSDNLTISLPIKVRGQAIGAIRLKKTEIAEAWTQEETNLAIALSDQLSGALESARLYRESQQRVARESLVSDISARITSISRVDNIVRETVQELGQALGNASVTFQLLDQFESQAQPLAGNQVTGQGRGNEADTSGGRSKE